MLFCIPRMPCYHLKGKLMQLLWKSLLWFVCSAQLLNHVSCSAIISYQVSSVQWLSHVRLFATRGLQHTRLSCPSPTPRADSNLCPLSWWCHATISSSVVRSSFRLQSLPASGSFPMSQFFPSGGQSIGVSV